MADPNGTMARASSPPGQIGSPVNHDAHDADTSRESSGSVGPASAHKDTARCDNNDDGHDKAAPSPPQNSTAAAAAGQQPKKGLLARLGVEPFVLLMCLKGAVAPTIGLAMFQADAVANYFVTIGYLVGIISVLAMPIMPRGKFLQSMVLNVLGVSIGAAVGLLALWSAYKAREHTQSRPSGYNSSQSAVSAIWLFVNIWFSNFMRAKNPSLNLPVVVYTIMVNISATYSPLMTSVVALEAFMKQLYVAMLSAFGLAFGVSLLILPTSSRMVASGQLKGLIMLLKGVVKQEQVYLESLEKEDMFAVPAFISAGTGLEDAARVKAKDKAQKDAVPNSHAEATMVKETIFKIRELLGKIQVDLPFAQREVAWGKLQPKHFKHVTGLLRDIVVATTGIGTIIDIFQRIAEKRGWVTDENTDLELLSEKMDEKRVWNGVMKQLHEPFRILAEAIDQGLEHAGIVLELLPKPEKDAKEKNKDKKNKTDIDIEAKGDLVNPGDAEFANILRSKVRTFHTVRKQILHAWARENGLAHDNIEDVDVFSANEEKHQHERQQLFVLLYIETLMQAAGVAVIKLVEYADNRTEDGSMAKNHLIMPKNKKLKEWVTSILENRDRSQDQNADLFDPGLAVVYTGSGFTQKNPEHRTPTTAWQRAGELLRKASQVISSRESGFGLRCACATMTIGIVAFLEDSHVFFQQQRLVWAMIMVALAMTQTSGQSIYGFFCRVGGTLIAMVLAIVNYYIVNGNTAGVLVFLYIFLSIEYIFFFKYPAVIQASIICVVTHIMIIGYELQSTKLGIAVTERTGQPYYPIYELAPYRLATVAGGCFVAFLWTIFPSPITDRTWLRRDLAATLFLLAKYFGVLQQKLRVTLDPDVTSTAAGSPSKKGSLVHTLSRHQRQLSAKLMLLLPSLSQHAEFQKWEPSIGGEFPRDVYEDIITRSMRISSYITLIEHTIDNPAYTTGAAASEDGVNRGLSTTWMRALRGVLAESDRSQDNIVCTLVLLSNALDSGHALPPHLPLPKPYALTRMLEQMRDAQGNRKGLELLDAKHMADSGYAEFAVLQVCASMICDDLEGLVRDIGELVGNVDFSFEINDHGSREKSGGLLRRMTTLVGGAGGEGRRGRSSISTSTSSSSSSSDGDGSSRTALGSDGSRQQRKAPGSGSDGGDETEKRTKND